ncbi:hypothetical protein ACI65C_009146 [Semiaphis heraclei]
MLKLFFVIATFMVLVKSEITVKWFCEETNSMGNCSTLPKITDWLQTLSDNIDSDRFTDVNFCPFDITERHGKCMWSYIQSCYWHISDVERNIFFSYLPRTEIAKTYCIEGRDYKDEFRVHAACTKSMYKSGDEWRIHSVNQEVEFGLIPTKTDDFEKCYIYQKFWQSQSLWIREQCGKKTEKFSRQVLRHMWPIMGLLNLCGEELTADGYFES